MVIDKIIKDLERVKGLSNVKLLDQEHKKIIFALEDKNNLGVRECLRRKFTIALAHDSTFRDPVGRIVFNSGSGIVLPPVAFPEVKGRDVVSSSPSENVHRVIVEKLDMRLKEDEATLLIGFNL